MPSNFVTTSLKSCRSVIFLLASSLSIYFTFNISIWFGNGQKRLESLSEAELETLMAQVDEEKSKVE